jgi:hypothetical protein
MAGVSKETGATAPKPSIKPPATAKATSVAKAKPTATVAQGKASTTPKGKPSPQLVAQATPSAKSAKSAKPAQTRTQAQQAKIKTAANSNAPKWLKDAGQLASVALSSMAGIGTAGLALSALSAKPANANEAPKADAKPAEKAPETKEGVAKKPDIQTLADGSVIAKVTLANGQQVSTTFTPTGAYQGQATKDNMAFTFVDDTGKEVTVGMADGKTVTSYVLPTNNNPNPAVTVSQFERLAQADGSVKQGKVDTKTLSANELASKNPEILGAKQQLGQQVAQLTEELKNGNLSDALKTSGTASLNQSQQILRDLETQPAMALTNGEGGLSRLAMASVSPPAQAETAGDPANQAEEQHAKGDKLTRKQRAFFEGARAVITGGAAVAGVLLGGTAGSIVPGAGTAAGAVAGGAMFGAGANLALSTVDNWIFKADDGLSTVDKLGWTAVDTGLGALGGAAGPLVGRAGSLAPAIVKNSKPIAFGASVLAKSSPIVQAGAKQAVPGAVIGGGSQLFSNARNGRPLDENVGQSALFGAGTGFVTGGVGYKLQSAQAARLASTSPSTVPSTNAGYQVITTPPAGVGTTAGYQVITTPPAGVGTTAGYQVITTPPAGVGTTIPTTSSGTTAGFQVITTPPAGVGSATPVAPPTVIPPARSIWSVNPTTPPPVVSPAVTPPATGIWSVSTNAPLPVAPVAPASNATVPAAGRAGWFGKHSGKLIFGLVAAQMVGPMVLGGNKPSTAPQQTQGDNQVEGQTPTETTEAEQPVYTFGSAAPQAEIPATQPEASAEPVAEVAPVEAVQPIGTETIDPEADTTSVEAEAELPQTLDDTNPEARG